MNGAIVVAGGRGLRMGGDVPKQFLSVHGRPILMWTLERISAEIPDLQLIVVLPQSHQGYWKELCDKYHFQISHQLANGGDSRFASVRNGLKCVADTVDVVCVHDGVRPFVSSSVIRTGFEMARKKGAAVPVVPLVDSVRKLNNDGSSQSVNRADYQLVQTPQFFNLKQLRRAYEQPFSEQFTDDASVVESMGEEVTLFPGNVENIKITRPLDCALAEVILAEQCTTF
jgi:2-C-methyl-D-erythritol 4-phosphate cytidylyltransferase